MQIYPVTREVDLLQTDSSVTHTSLTVDNRITEMLSGMGNSTLLECAWPLIAIITQLNFMHFNGYMAELKQFLITQLFNFETKATAAGVDQETIIRSRYLLCVVIDELILNIQFAHDQAWDEKDDWTRYSLVSTFYQDRRGGEKFFDLLDHLLINPAKHLPSLEIFLICLNLGFEGKYRLLPQGLEKLALMRERLYVCIMQYRRDSAPALVPEPHGKTAKPYLKWLPIFLIGSSLLLGSIIWLGYLHCQLDNMAAPVFHRIEMLASGAIQ